LAPLEREGVNDSGKEQKQNEEAPPIGTEMAYAAPSWLLLFLNFTFPLK